MTARITETCASTLTLSMTASPTCEWSTSQKEERNYVRNTLGDSKQQIRIDMHHAPLTCSTTSSSFTASHLLLLLLVHFLEINFAYIGRLHSVCGVNTGTQYFTYTCIGRSRHQSSNDQYCCMLRHDLVRSWLTEVKGLMVLRPVCIVFCIGVEHLSVQDTVNEVAKQFPGLVPAVCVLA